MKQANAKSTRIVIFDYLKAVAIIFVVINHYFQSSWDYLHNSIFDIPVSIIYPMIIQMAVPVFMIVTGCTFAMSYNKKYSKLSQMYHPRDIISKILRFWIPFFFAFAVEVLLFVFIKDRSYTPLALLKYFLIGGVSKNGSYYTPVLVQLVFIFPLIFTLIKKYNIKGLILLIAVNLVYEVLCNTFKMNPYVYRLLMPRYITYVALGAWLYFNNWKINKKAVLVSFVIGLAYIIARQMGLKPFILKKWSGTSMVIALYIFPVVAYIIGRFKSFSPKEGLVNSTLLTLGNASFHIFLVQMIFYNVFDNYIIKAFNNPFINIPLNLLICIGAGVGFFYAEKGISKRILKLI